MNSQELVVVVARIQAGDNRVVDRVTMSHWQETIGHLPQALALEAVVMHFRESTAYLMPAHILNNAQRIREDRAQRMGISTDDDRPLGSGAPEPHNMVEMTAAWNDPDEFRRQCAIYNRQLVNAGFEIDHRYPVAPPADTAAAA